MSEYVYPEGSPEKLYELFLTEKEIKLCREWGLGAPYAWVFLDETYLDDKFYIRAEIKFIGNGMNFGIRNGKRFVDWGRNPIKDEYWDFLERIWAREFGGFAPDPRSLPTKIKLFLAIK